jgi:hypothetical protein
VSGTLALPQSQIFKFHASDTCPYTVPSHINVFGAITGTCSTGPGARTHGFVRDAQGNITIFDPAGSTFTSPISINNQGYITGYYVTDGGAFGFVRAPDGSFAAFNFTSPQFATLPADINAAGDITGSVAGLPSTPGFLRAPNGTFTPINVPFQIKGTVPFAINEVGYITGAYFTVGGIPQGFLYEPSGSYILFQAGFQGTLPLGINRENTIAGFYTAPPNQQGGFLRTADGTITLFPLPAGGTIPPTGLFFYARATSGLFGGLNLAGAVVGTYRDQNNDAKGFLRAPDGTLTVIDLGPGNTTAVEINDSGQITGSYLFNGKSVGYLWEP